MVGKSAAAGRTRSTVTVARVVVGPQADVLQRPCPAR